MNTENMKKMDKSKTSTSHPEKGCGAFAPLGLKKSLAGYSPYGGTGMGLGMIGAGTKMAYDGEMPSIDQNGMRQAYLQLLHNAAKVMQDCAYMMQRLDENYSAQLNQAMQKFDQNNRQWEETTEHGYEEAYQLIMEVKRQLDNLKSRSCPNCGSKDHQTIEVTK